MILTRLRCGRVLQLTLAVIKPDAVAHPLILEALHHKILENNFIIVRRKDLIWKSSDSERFYAEHKGRFFYQRLVEFMSSGPMRAYILAREEAVSHWRELMGPTKVYRARYTSPKTIRAQYGLTDTRNTTHGSELLVFSDANATSEVVSEGMLWIEDNGMSASVLVSQVDSVSLVQLSMYRGSKASVLEPPQPMILPGMEDEPEELTSGTSYSSSSLF